MNWYLSLSRGKQIAAAVLMAHVFVLCLLGIDHWMHRTPREKKITVNTFVLSAPPKVATKAAPVSPAKAPAAAPPKKATAKHEEKKQPAQTASRLPAPQKPEPQESLLSEIEKNLESLAASATSAKKSNIVIPHLNIKAQAPTVESSGVEQIAAFLQEALELPEFGEVKIKLSINRFGSLEKLEILDAKSQKNGEFLKKRLPELQFPCLNEVTTLTIVFSNAL